jgi:hypothetical protein
VLLGRGNGNFRAPVTTTTTGDGEFVPKAFALRDLNHDGKLDLVAQYGVDVDDYASGPSYDAVVVSFGKGNGTFSQTTENDLNPQLSLEPFKVADFNRDGNADLGFVTNSGIAVMLGNGDGTFQSDTQFGHSSGDMGAVGDFDGNGSPDLATTWEGVTTAAIFLNRSDRATYHGLADGVWYFHVRAVDASAVGGLTATRAVRIDTHRPSTQAPDPASVQRGGIVQLSYEVGDPPPSAGWCSVRVEVRNGRGTVLFRHTSGHAHSGVLYQTGFRCDLTKGTYRFSVYATDAAGNTQSNLAWNRLVVK